MATEKKHDTCIDVTPIDAKPRSMWVCGPNCPPGSEPRIRVYPLSDLPEIIRPKRKGRGKLWRWMRGIK